jgi:C_GCAxxG_C_C family probable redox protein
MKFEESARGKQARDNFNSGYNCSQSVLLAYEDYLKEKGLDTKTVLRMASPLGGGISRLREVCGAVSALCLLIGLTDGYDTPDDEKKKALYSKVQKLVMDFQECRGSIICRELLGLEQKHDQPTPSKRTKEYYAERPCADLCATAATIFEKNCL